MSTVVYRKKGVNANGEPRTMIVEQDKYGAFSWRIDKPGPHLHCTDCGWRRYETQGAAVRSVRRCLKTLAQ